MFLAEQTLMRSYVEEDSQFAWTKKRGAAQEVTKQQMDSLSILRDKFHGDWNYTIQPRGRN